MTSKREESGEISLCTKCQPVWVPGCMKYIQCDEHKGSVGQFCPTCGSSVTVGGEEGETRFYIPKTEQEEDIMELVEVLKLDYQLERFECSHYAEQRCKCGSDQQKIYETYRKKRNYLICKHSHESGKPEGL